ncbi:S phase cyclin A associated protein in the, partial [Fasciolopsis buskii]
GRRRALEASRRARLDALQARWESRAQQLASRAELLEHSRRAAARAKELNREVKIASLEEQQRTHIEQLRSKIQRKQEESERRHQEQLREISRKAFEMSVLTHTADDSITAVGMEPYPIQKWCRACQVTIVSEVALKSHLQGKRHQTAVLEAGQNRPLDRSDVEAFNLLHLVDAPPELLDPISKAEQDRLKMRRRRARKLRQRMNIR